MHPHVAGTARVRTAVMVAVGAPSHASQTARPGTSGGVDKSMLPGHNQTSLAAKLEATRAAFRAAQVGKSADNAMVSALHHAARVTTPQLPALAFFCSLHGPQHARCVCLWCAGRPAVQRRAQPDEPAQHPRQRPRPHARAWRATPRL